MSTEQSFIDFVRDQASAAGNVSVRKMFGEYALYCDEKVVALICDNQFFLKPTAAGRAVVREVVEAPPYPGAKPSWLISAELDDADALARLIRVTADALPSPKPKPKARAKKKKTTKRASGRQR